MAKWAPTVFRALAALPMILGSFAAHGHAPSQADLQRWDVEADKGDVELASLLIPADGNAADRVHVASRFKGPGDTGRPDIFGEPGKPDIGAPGRSGY